MSEINLKPIPKHSHFIDLTFEKFNRLLVIGYAGKNHDCRDLWVCICDCGEFHICMGRYLKSGHTKSCGCLRKETIGMVKLSHGAAGSVEYRIYQKMIKRCHNKKAINFHNYGGRGIKVCSRWRNGFENFIADMGKRPSKTHSIERIDNDGNYEPENCKWATAKEQAFNRRTNHLLTYEGETLPLSIWAEKMGITKAALFHRIYRGWTISKALTTPDRKSQNQNKL